MKIQIFSKLKSARFTGIKELNLIKIINNPSQKQLPEQKGTQLIDWNALNQQQKEALMASIPKAFKESGAEVLDAEYVDGVEDYKEKEKVDGGSNTINFFDGKIPKEDIYVLKASAYIKKVFDGGGSVEVFKRQLRYKYGERGTNICNLYSAGYFESWIRPLYESSPDNFQEAYEIVIKQLPFAIFVHGDMTIADIEKKVKEKAKENKLYGIKFINLHGIGTDNINKITKASGELLAENPDFKITYEAKGMFVARIELP
ncbi:MAG: hypothetical protein AAB656_01885 [Patescibacteria group bacterium]